MVQITRLCIQEGTHVLATVAVHLPGQPEARIAHQIQGLNWATDCSHELGAYTAKGSSRRAWFALVDAANARLRLIEEETHVRFFESP